LPKKQKQFQAKKKCAFNEKRNSQGIL